MLLRFKFRCKIIFFYVSNLRAGTQAEEVFSESVISLLVISVIQITSSACVLHI